MSSHNPRVFQELLAGFRDGYAKYGDSAFVLEALSQDEKESLPDEFEPALLDRIGSIATPWSQWSVWGSCGLPVNYPTNELYAKAVQLSRSASKCFEPLVRRAGAQLPAVIREAFPANPPDAQSWWTSLLWWIQVPDEEEYDLRDNRRRIVAVSPFEDSAQVIESLGLATDSPRMPFRVHLEGDALNPVIVYEGEDEEAANNTATAKKLKRSTASGEAEAKLIGALTAHHQYDDSGCLNMAPIGNNELARQAEVDRHTASDFFKTYFGGHAQYKAACVNPERQWRIVEQLKVLNGDFTVFRSLNGEPSGEDNRSDDEE